MCRLGEQGEQREQQRSTSMSVPANPNRTAHGPGNGSYDDGGGSFMFNNDLQQGRFVFFFLSFILLTITSRHQHHHYKTTTTRQVEKLEGQGRKRGPNDETRFRRLCPRLERAARI